MPPERDIRSMDGLDGFHNTIARSTVVTPGPDQLLQSWPCFFAGNDNGYTGGRGPMLFPSSASPLSDVMGRENRPGSLRIGNTASGPLILVASPMVGALVLNGPDARLDWLPASSARGVELGNETTTIAADGGGDGGGWKGAEVPGRSCEQWVC